MALRNGTLSLSLRASNAALNRGNENHLLKLLGMNSEIFVPGKCNKKKKEIKPPFFNFHEVLIKKDPFFGFSRTCEVYKNDPFLRENQNDHACHFAFGVQGPGETYAR